MTGIYRVAFGDGHAPSSDLRTLRGALGYKAGQTVFCGQRFSLWDSYGLVQHELRAGSFSQDARGRWYLNVQVKLEIAASTGAQTLGVDLKTAATCSDGRVLGSGVLAGGIQHTAQRRAICMEGLLP